jgi:hypothetical protein
MADVLELGNQHTFIKAGRDRSTSQSTMCGIELIMSVPLMLGSLIPYLSPHIFASEPERRLVNVGSRRTVADVRYAIDHELVGCDTQGLRFNLSGSGVKVRL